MNRLAEIAGEMCDLCGLDTPDQQILNLASCPWQIRKGKGLSHDFKGEIPPALLSPAETSTGLVWHHPCRGWWDKNPTGAWQDESSPPAGTPELS